MGNEKTVEKNYDKIEKTRESREDCNNDSEEKHTVLGRVIIHRGAVGLAYVGNDDR